MKNATKGRIIKGVAVGLDVGAPLVATLAMFPIWVERSAEATMSGLFLFMALLSCIPFLRQIIAYFKSPAVEVMWCIIFVLLVALSNIIHEMMVVAGVGAVANLIGAGVYKLGGIVGAKTD